MKRCAVLFILCTCALSPFFAQHSGNKLDPALAVLGSFLSEEQQTELLHKGCLLRSVYNQKSAAPIFVPPFAVPQNFAEAWNKGELCFFIEALYLHKKAQGSVKDVEKISRILRSVSKLKGLRYYSSSRKKMRTLYEASYVIDNPQTGRRMEDPIDNLETDFSVYVFQKDLTFGGNNYRYRFCSDADSAGFLSANIETLKYSIFKAVEPECLQASVAVTDLGEYLLMYALTRAQFVAPSMLQERVQNSFRTRGEAVYGWFIAQYERESEGSAE